MEPFEKCSILIDTDVISTDSSAPPELVAHAKEVKRDYPCATTEEVIDREVYT